MFTFRNSALIDQGVGLVLVLRMASRGTEQHLDDSHFKKQELDVHNQIYLGSSYFQCFELHIETLVSCHALISLTVVGGAHILYFQFLLGEGFWFVNGGGANVCEVYFTAHNLEYIQMLLLCIMVLFNNKQVNIFLQSITSSDSE